MHREFGAELNGFGSNLIEDLLDIWVIIPLGRAQRDRTIKNLDKIVEKILLSWLLGGIFVAYRLQATGLRPLRSSMARQNRPAKIERISRSEH